MSWTTVKLGEVITHRKEFITISDTVEYKRCRVQVNRKGVVLRDSVKGIQINTKKQQVCKEGDFLVAEIDAKVGGYGFVPADLEGAIVSSHYFLFEVDETKMLKRYLAWIIKTDIIQEQISSKGSTNYAAIRPSHVLNFEIPLPSLAEQNELIKKLDSFYQEYEIIQAELLNQENYLTLLRQSILQEAVQGKLVPQDAKDEPAEKLLQRIKAEKARLIKEGKLKKEKELPPITEEEIPFELPEGWVWCRLGDIINLTSGVTLGKTYKEELISVPYLRVANVQRGFVDLTHLKQLSVPKSEIEKYALKKNDLVMIEGGDWDKVGRCAIWNGEIQTCIHQNHIFRIRFYGNISYQWAELFLNSPVARRYFESCSKQTTNLASINKTQLTNTITSLPPITEQHRIVAKIEQLMGNVVQLEKQIQQSKQQAQQLLQTILKEAFVTNGKAKKIKLYEENERVTMAAEE